MLYGGGWIVLIPSLANGECPFQQAESIFHKKWQMHHYVMQAG